MPRINSRHSRYRDYYFSDKRKWRKETSSGRELGEYRLQKTNTGLGLMIFTIDSDDEIEDEIEEEEEQQPTRDKKARKGSQMRFDFDDGRLPIDKLTQGILRRDVNEDEMNEDEDDEETGDEGLADHVALLDTRRSVDLRHSVCYGNEDSPLACPSRASLD